jgi:hypothetical protein
VTGKERWARQNRAMPKQTDSVTLYKRRNRFHVPLSSSSCETRVIPDLRKRGTCGLGPDTVGVDAFGDEGFDHVSCVLLLGVAFEGHGDVGLGWSLELGREVAVPGKGVDKVDVRV